MIGLLELFKFKSVSLMHDSLVFVLVRLLFWLSSYCSTFAVSCKSSSTLNCSNLLGESAF